jgi:hypothetical protein
MTMSFCWMRKILAGRPDANMPALLTRMCQVAEPWAGQYSAWSRLACTWRDSRKLFPYRRRAASTAEFFALTSSSLRRAGLTPTHGSPLIACRSTNPMEATNG